MLNTKERLIESIDKHFKRDNRGYTDYSCHLLDADNNHIFDLNHILWEAKRNDPIGNEQHITLRVTDICIEDFIINFFVSEGIYLYSIDMIEELELLGDRVKVLTVAWADNDKLETFNLILQLIE